MFSYRVKMLAISSVKSACIEIFVDVYYQAAMITTFWSFVLGEAFVALDL